MLLADISAKIALAALARACRLSRSHFGRGFKRSFGCAPHRWIVARRLECAVDLLENTSVPLGEIALATGFADQSHFTRVFTRCHETTPGAWRRGNARRRADAAVPAPVERRSALPVAGPERCAPPGRGPAQPSTSTAGRPSSRNAALAGRTH